MITIQPGVGEAGMSIAYIRLHDDAVDGPIKDRYDRVIALSSRCVHVGCPVRYVAAARSFVCPCRGGVYDFRGLRTGGPPPRPLDRFYTLVRDGQVLVGPRYSVNSERRARPSVPSRPAWQAGPSVLTAAARRPRQTLPILHFVKRIGFLSFGHWQNQAWSRTRTAREALTQTIEVAEAAEGLGIDGAFVRVHHFARQLASPFPLLAAIGARTSRIEIGTGVIDMRYENPLYMAEEAAAADLIAGGRLQLGISRGSPEPALDGAHAFGYVPREGKDDAELAREKTALFRAAIAGAGVVQANPEMTGAAGLLPIQPQSPDLPQRIWWGSGTRESARWAGEQGMNLMSSTLLLEDTGVPFDELQAEQISIFREAWAGAGHSHEPRVSVSRSVIPVVSDEDRLYFGGRHGEDRDQLGYLDGAFARFGRSYTGEPDRIAEELAGDVAVQAADTLLLTVPNQLGVEYNTRMLESIAREIAPAIGWRPAQETIGT